MTEELLFQLEQQGYKGQIVSIQHLHDLQEGIEARRREGTLDEQLYQAYLTFCDFKPPENLSGARSIIVVAVAQPQVVFTWKGESLPVIIPPTYLQYPNQQVQELLVGILGPKGYKITPAALPVKLLAVRSGLGAYGKNNLCYVPGLGSFHRLMAFYSEFPCQQDLWQEPQMMESCQNCAACLRSCPTGAIRSERFLLYAERCLTFHNERKGDFPIWLDPAWHHCLVGCLYCQQVCPQNKNFLPWIEKREEFSEEETRLLLEGTPRHQLPADIVRKLEQLDLMEYFEVLPRNLGVLLEV
ncbi:MAG: FeS-binding protein [candidate division KSB1 bacterium]|nr:FeS-binding protein [candidate division KSB1 bacterium]